jgi:alpha-glucosidase (family GH31 glycosyl hydrolase)
MRRTHNQVFVFGLALIFSAIILSCQVPLPETGVIEREWALPVQTHPDAHEEITSGQVVRALYRFEDVILVLEFLRDDLIHVEAAIGVDPPALDEPLFTTDMVARHNFPGPGAIRIDEQGQIDTDLLTVGVAEDGCIHVVDRRLEQQTILAPVCPRFEGQRRLEIISGDYTDAYGLGEQFLVAGEPDGSWAGRVRLQADRYGNALQPFQGGMVSNNQFPIAFFTGSGTDAFGIFYDNPLAQRWDFREDTWQIIVPGQMRFFILTGPDLIDLRQDYLELTGRPPLPPKKMFGLWLSEYGYRSWEQVDEILASMRANQFPLDGFVLDLFWFGGIEPGEETTQMGSLTWDESAFPEPAEKIAELGQQGIGIILIEEPYIGRALEEHAELEQRGYLVRAQEGGEAAFITTNPWWGLGGMLDFSHPEGTAFWHDWRREPLIDDGILGHWTDLGEPELFNPGAWYYGVETGEGWSHLHPDVHNLYNLLWSRSIVEGYERSERQGRPFILSRSGTSGSQRYSAALWSGDIGSNLSSLAAQFNVQMHMAMSGVDYYGSDIGGFYRHAIEGNPLLAANVNEMYTQWYAYGMLFEVPGRPHVMNLAEIYETAPDRIGHLESNLAHTRLRYALHPYVYSLAHRAYCCGEAIFPPLVYYFQEDTYARTRAADKMIGPYLLVGAVAQRGATEREVYLPEGEWIDFYSGERYASSSEYTQPLPLYEGDLFRLPIFARAGAIIPQMHVDEQTLDLTGLRADGTTRDEMIFTVVSGPQSAFTLYEDDGETIAYQRGAVRQTDLSQETTGGVTTIQISGAQGTYAGALDRREIIVRLAVPAAAGISAVSWNGEDLPRVDNAQDAPQGWAADGLYWIVIRLGEQDVTVEHTLTAQ